jgi:hypothetical protein
VKRAVARRYYPPMLYSSYSTVAAINRQDLMNTCLMRKARHDRGTGPARDTSRRIRQATSDRYARAVVGSVPLRPFGHDFLEENAVRYVMQGAILGAKAN